MLVKPKYTNEGEAPVRFLKLICVTLPIACVLMLFEILALSHILPTYFIVFYIFIWILDIIAAIGLNFRRWFGAVVYIVDTTILSIPKAYMDFLDGDIYMVVSRIIVDIAFLFICLIYFGKRRLLFDPKPKNYHEIIHKQKYEIKIDSFTNEENTDVVVDESLHKVTDCSQIKISIPDDNPSVEQTSFYQGEKKNEKRVYGPLDPPDEKSKKTSSIVISIICILICLLVGASGWIAAYIEKEQVVELQSNIESLNKQREFLKKKNETLQEELDTKKNVIDLMLPAAYMTEKQIGFIVHGSKYYHQFKCSVYQAEDEFWAHNIEYCKYLGYEECPLCWNDDASYTPNNKLHLVPKS